MRIGYFVAAHKQPGLLRRLVRVLLDQRDIILIHVDKKAAADVHEDVARLATDYDNVRLLPSAPVTWGGWSQVDVELSALEYLTHPELAWDYYINLSGQDFPIKSIDKFRAFLQEHAGRNFVDVRSISDLRPPLKKVVERRRSWLSVESGGRAYWLPVWMRPYLARRTDYYGSSWHILSRPFCEWVKNEGRARIRHMRLMRSPDESFMQTLLLESPFADTLIDDNKRFYHFKNKPNPEILTLNYLDRLISSRAYFARKFDETKSAKLLDAIEGWLNE